MTVTVQTYKRHERSREAIELAYDSILQEKMKVRHKYGFQPPRRGRRSDLQGDPLVKDLTLHMTLVLWKGRLRLVGGSPPVEHRSRCGVGLA